MARNYDGRDPYGSLARASLTESAQFQRDQYELNRKIALEGDPERRDMLMARRDIEHNDHMGQAYERVAGQTQAITGNQDHPDVKAARDKAAEFRTAAQQVRREWAERSVDQPALYPPLNEQMRAQVKAARQEKGRPPTADAPQAASDPSREPAPAPPSPQPAESRAPDPDPARAPFPDQPVDRARLPPEPAGERPSPSARDEARQPAATPEPPQPEREEQPARSPTEETRAMERMNLPEYAAEKHGYAVEWKDRAKDSRAILHKGSEELRAAKREDGSWTYANRHDGTDRGDIVDFEAKRGAGSRAEARETIRPELERTEQQQGRQLDQPQGQAEIPDRGEERAAADTRAEQSRPPLRNPDDYRPPADTSRDGPER